MITGIFVEERENKIKEKTKAYDELENIKETLEVRVKARTRELRELNESLRI